VSTPAANVTNTSGTYGFAPSMGEAVLYAAGLCGVRNTAMTQSHFETARMAANMLLGRWSSDGVNLWAVDLQCVQLQQGCSTYQVPSNTITILDAYIGYTNGTTEIDRLILPISRTEYASYANKQQQGSVTTYWFDRLTAAHHHAMARAEFHSVRAEILSAAPVARCGSSRTARTWRFPTISRKHFVSDSRIGLHSPGRPRKCRC
jgi:hypothetical protein